MKCYFWRRKALKDCDPCNLVACIKFCWNALSARKRHRARKQLIKIANRLAKDKYKEMWK